MWRSSWNQNLVGKNLSREPLGKFLNITLSQTFQPNDPFSFGFLQFKKKLCHQRIAWKYWIYVSSTSIFSNKECWDVLWSKPSFFSLKLVAIIETKLSDINTSREDPTEVLMTSNLPCFVKKFKGSYIFKQRWK